MPSISNDYLNRLHELIIAHFNINELQELAFELGIDYETIAGTEKNSKTREFILFCSRRDLVEELITKLKDARPTIDWPSLHYESRVDIPIHRENPFLVGSAVHSEFFIGRSAIIEAIKSRVGHYAGLQSLSLVSNRRMGKTSLLKYIHKNYKTFFGSEHTYATVYIDASDADAYTNADIMALLRENIKVQTGLELWEEKNDGKLYFLSRGFKKLANTQDIRLVLLLDEWEGVMTHPEVDKLLKALRANGSQGNIGMITATRRSLFELCIQGKLTSNFYNIFSQQYLNNFLDEEWENLVKEYYARSDHVPHWRDLSLIGELAGGHPHLTQLAGSLVWQAEQQQWNETQVRQVFYDEASKMVFYDIWRHLDEGQIQAIKNSLSIPPFQEVPESVVVELKARGILSHTGEVFCSPFAQYIKQEGI